MLACRGCWTLLLDLGSLSPGLIRRLTTLTIGLDTKYYVRCVHNCVLCLWSCLSSCVPLCDGKVTIFECGGEKHSLGTQNSNITHDRDETLYPVIQTTCSYVQTDATHETKHLKESGPWSVRDAQSARLTAVVVQKSGPAYSRLLSQTIQRAFIVWWNHFDFFLYSWIVLWASIL
jgi:hypothetical protein